MSRDPDLTYIWTPKILFCCNLFHSFSWSKLVNVRLESISSKVSFYIKHTPTDPIYLSYLRSDIISPPSLVYPPITVKFKRCFTVPTCPTQLPPPHSFPVPLIDLHD